MPFTSEEKVYVDAARKLAEIAKSFGVHMVNHISMKDVDSFRSSAYFFYRLIMRAEVFCDLVSGETEKEECLIPVMAAEEETIQKLREALSK